MAPKPVMTSGEPTAPSASTWASVARVASPMASPSTNGSASSSRAMSKRRLKSSHCSCWSMVATARRSPPLSRLTVPASTSMSVASNASVQWAAVRTCLGLSKVPPQNC